MKKLLFALTILLACCGAAAAQKVTAEPDYYPQGFNGDA
jgi:hypothetical protein